MKAWPVEGHSIDRPTVVTVVGWFGLIAAGYLGLIVAFQIYVFHLMATAEKQSLLYTPASPEDLMFSFMDTVSLFYGLGGGALLGLLAATSAGLLRGWRWARWGMTVFIVLCLITGVAWSGLLLWSLGKEQAGGAGGFAWFQAGVIATDVVVVLGLSWVIGKLHTKPVRGWFGGGRVHS